ncbi:Lrp/AsnC family transcriptional regulator [Aeromonas caviae]|uniref:Lrp/AsnC family transcriptional regulator n=1 Tax=Aeromonas caviae TaxID=648 RepID=UPI003977CA45
MRCEKVGLSLSPCHRYLKSLEQSSAIRDYRVQIDPFVLGLDFSARVFVAMRGASQKAMKKLKPLSWISFK